jgi:hypothetical protein
MLSFMAGIVAGIVVAGVAGVGLWQVEPMRAQLVHSSREFQGLRAQAEQARHDSAEQLRAGDKELHARGEELRKLRQETDSLKKERNDLKDKLSIPQPDLQHLQKDLAKARADAADAAKNLLDEKNKLELTTAELAAKQERLKKYSAALRLALQLPAEETEDPYLGNPEKINEERRKAYDQTWGLKQRHGKDLDKYRKEWDQKVRPGLEMKVKDAQAPGIDEKEKGKIIEVIRAQLDSMQHKLEELMKETPSQRIYDDADAVLRETRSFRKKWRALLQEPSKK